VERDDTPKDLDCAKLIVRAALHAAWAASKVGAISMATLWSIAVLGYGAYGAARGHLHILELLFVPVGGAVQLLLSLLFSFLITVPVSFIVAMCAYPFLRGLQGLSRKAFGIAGFLVGSLVWSGVWWWVPQGNLLGLLFASWISVFVIGGLAVTPVVLRLPETSRGAVKAMFKWLIR
jgi:hypothetical protein